MVRVHSLVKCLTTYTNDNSFKLNINEIEERICKNG